MTGPVTIRVVVTGPAQMGRFPYRIDTEGTMLRHPVTGLSATPLLDACRTLKQLTAASDAAFIGLYDKDCNIYRMRTQVGYGAKWRVEETGSGPKFRPYEPPEVLEARFSRAVEGQGSIKAPEGTGVEATGAKPAISPAAPPPPHKPRASLAGTGQGRTEPAKPKSSHPKRKPTGSGGRRGRR